MIPRNKSDSINGSIQKEEGNYAVVVLKQSDRNYSVDDEIYYLVGHTDIR